VSCENGRRNKNVLSCRDLAIGGIIELSTIGCVAAGVACQSSATFKVETWNTFNKDVTYLWEVSVGDGAVNSPSVVIDGDNDMDTVVIWVHADTNTPINIKCTVSDGTHTDTLTIEYISENE